MSASDRAGLRRAGERGGAAEADMASSSSGSSSEDEEFHEAADRRSDDELEDDEDDDADLEDDLDDDDSEVSDDEGMMAEGHLQLMRLLGRFLGARPPAENAAEFVEPEEEDTRPVPIYDGQFSAHPHVAREHFAAEMGNALGASVPNKRFDSNVHAILQDRVRNLSGVQGLSRGQRSALASRFRPGTVSTRVAEFDEHLFCGTYSQDGSMFMSSCQDAFLRLYDTQGLNFSLKLQVQARDVGWAVVDTCYSPDQHFLIYSSWSQYIHLITLDGDRHEALDLTPEGRGHICPFSIRFSEDSREIVCGLNTSEVCVYDCIADRRVVAIRAHDDDVNAVAFLDESSNLFASGSDDYLCKVWDRRTLREDNPQPVGVMRGHAGGITYIDGKGDGRYFISQSKDHSIKLWDIRHMGDANTEAPALRSLDYRLAGVVENRNRRRLRGDMSLMTYSGAHSVFRTLIRARFSPAHSTGQRYVYTGDARGACAIYDTLTGEVVDTIDCHRGIVRDVSWHPHRPHLVTSSWDGSVERNMFEGNRPMDDSECKAMVLD